MNTEFNSDLLEINYRGSCAYKNVGFHENVYRAGVDGPYIAMVGITEEVKDLAPNKNLIGWLSHWEDAQEAAWCVHMFMLDYEHNMKEFNQVGQGNWRPSDPVPNFSKQSVCIHFPASKTSAATKQHNKNKINLNCKLLEIGKLFCILVNQHSLTGKEASAKLTKKIKEELNTRYKNSTTNDECITLMEQCLIKYEII